MRERSIGLLTCVAALAATVLISMAIPTDGYAQDRALEANVPFEFRVGDVTFPAGKYLLARVGTGDAVRITDGTRTAVVLTNVSLNPAHASGRSSLIFNGYSDTYFLAELRWDGYRESRLLRQSKVELELAKVPPAPKSIALTATR